MLTLKGPVLSLTIDAVVKMHGEGAACDLLSLFHKCKEGLQDGDRLENMAWRLWHVERASSQPCYPSSPAPSSPDSVASPFTSSASSCSERESDASSDGDALDHDQATTLGEGTGATNYKDKESNSTPSKPLSSIPGAPPDGQRSALEGRRSLSPVSVASRRTSSCCRPSLSCRRTHSNTSIGQIMADLLPEKLNLHRSASLNALADQNSGPGKSPTLRGVSEQVPAFVVVPDVPLSQPQTQPFTTGPGPGETMGFPTVVIVNPTPHPTPPMTPQVSSPPTPASSDVNLMPKRDSLTVVTSIRSPISPTLPPTPESMQERDFEESTLSAPGTRASLHPPASGPRSNSHRSSDAVQPNGSVGKSTAVNGTSNVLKFGSGPPNSNSSLNPPERKFFITQAGGSPDGDSPDTSTSSLVGSQSGLSVSAATSSALVDKRAEETATGCEPASVASRASDMTPRSHSSNGSSSKAGGLMKRRKSPAASTNAKGKGKEMRPGHGPSGMHRSQSSNRIYRLQVGPDGLTGGTLQKSKIGGRTAATLSNSATLIPGQSSKQQSVRPPPTSGVSMHPPPPAPVSRVAQAEKSAGPSTSGTRPDFAARRSSSSRRSSKSGASAKSAKGHAALPSASLKQRRLDFADDSDYSTDTEEWDTEDASEEVDGTSGGDNEQMIREKQVRRDRTLEEAAAEAERQRNLFAKVDRRSYADLTRVRTQPGLLTAMFHPDPQLFPAEHPYRHSRSTQDILAHVNRPSYHPAPLQPAKSTAAVPVAAAVTAQGVGTPIQTNNRQRSPLRLKGRPQDMEESESGEEEEEEEENKLHVSESVAEKRLAMLHRQNTKGPARPQEPSRLTQQAHATRQGQQTMALPATGQVPVGRLDASRAGPSPLARVATEPIPLGYPYNLPPPLPPSTPRTTRRVMLTNELSESLRRNLLWERQVSKQRPMGRRPVTTTAVPLAGPSGLRTSTAAVSNGQNNGNVSGVTNDEQTAQDEQAAKLEREEKLKARNRSWADDYHTTGW